MYQILRSTTYALQKSIAHIFNYKTMSVTCKTIENCMCYSSWAGRHAWALNVNILACLCKNTSRISIRTNRSFLTLRNCHFIVQNDPELHVLLIKHYLTSRALKCRTCTNSWVFAPLQLTCVFSRLLLWAPEIFILSFSLLLSIFSCLHVLAFSPFPWCCLSLSHTFYPFQVSCCYLFVEYYHTQWRSFKHPWSYLASWQWASQVSLVLLKFCY